MPYSPPRTRNLYDPSAEKPFKLSRSKIELFVRCPRCFYLDRRLGVDHPPMPAFTLNSAVDALLKTEFDRYREKGEAHPIMIEHKIKAVPFKHPELDKWRQNFTGIQFLHNETNLLLHGAVDDLWVNEDGELIVVDYKATAKAEQVELNGKWHEGYKRQAEIYQWLLRKNGFKVNSCAYFLYCNGDASKPTFNNQLQFRVQLLPHIGDGAWIEPTIFKLHQCLQSEKMPEQTSACDYCNYMAAVKEVEGR